MYTVRPVMQRGFSLLELSIVLVILALIVGSGISALINFTSNAEEEVTRTRMAVIEKAFLDYRRAFNRIPCPADITLALTAANFGVEAATPGTCIGGTPAANFNDASNGVAGMIPVKALRLPEEYAFDGWGRRMLYALDRRYSALNAFVTNAVSVQGSISVQDASGTASANAVYALVSHGRNGHGAYPRSGGSTRINAASVNTREQENCECNASAVSGTFDVTFVRAPFYANPGDVNDVFDDMLVSKNREHMLDYDE